MKKGKPSSCPEEEKEFTRRSRMTKNGGNFASLSQKQKGRRKGGNERDDTTGWMGAGQSLTSASAGGEERLRGINKKVKQLALKGKGESSIS